MQISLKNRYAALHYFDFRLIWTGQFISIIGSQMQTVAINWQIWTLTHSAVALGLIGMARFIPIVIFSLIGGAFADAHNRKKVLFTTQIFSAVLAGLLAFLTLSHTVTSVWIYMITALSAATLSFDSPARQAMIPNLVSREDLPNAMSLQIIGRQTAAIIGPAIGGFFIAATGVGTVYALNAASFIAVLIALVLMKTSGEVVGNPSPVSLKAVIEGLSFVKSKQIIWSTMILDALSTFFSSATTLLPIFATDILHVGATGLGILYSADSIGAVAAGLVLAHKHKIVKQGEVLLIAVGCYAIATIVFGFSRIFILSFLALLVLGAGDSISTVIRNTIRQLETPDHIRGRMTSVNMIFFMGGPQLGEFESGLVAGAFGAPFAVISGGIGTLLIVGLVAYAIPKLRNYRGSEVLE